MEKSVSLSPFHLAIPVYDLPAARDFYGRVFGLEEGRSSQQWVDFNFFGHQLVIHEHPKTASQESVHSNPVDGHDVPVPHFGVVLEWDQWEALAARLRSFGTKFVIEGRSGGEGQVQVFKRYIELPNGTFFALPTHSVQRKSGSPALPPRGARRH